MQRVDSRQFVAMVIPDCLIVEPTLAVIKLISIYTYVFVRIFVSLKTVTSTCRVTGSYKQIYYFRISVVLE
jgi:hypothetical protein